MLHKINELAATTPNAQPTLQTMSNQLALPGSLKLRKAVSAIGAAQNQPASQAPKKRILQSFLDGMKRETSFFP